MPMSLLRQLEKIGTHFTRMTSDSRKVMPGVAFAAYPGERADGRNYIPEAIDHGTAAVLWEREDFNWQADWKVANVGVTGLRDQVSEIASVVYGNPSEALTILGVTGTNGKTSVSHWLAQCLNKDKRRAAVLGTLGNGFLDHLQSAMNTTPDAIELQAHLADFLEQGATHVAMEVSSHGLVQGRVNGVQFDVAVFTNLSRDHLDYHGDMASYGEAKARLFLMPGLRHAVINLDDPFGRVLVRRLLGTGVSIIGYTLENRAKFDFPVLSGRDVSFSADGVSFGVNSPWGTGAVSAAVYGRFNAYNLLAVLGGLMASELTFPEALERIKYIKPVPGRMQQVGGGTKPLVLIDYAHTPDALEKTLLAAREITPSGGKLYCVFGCGGNRDSGKRPLMGQVAQRLADQVVLTSDNPRDEDPQQILSDIRAGMTMDCVMLADREQAIHSAISAATTRDVILVAGKGHEPYQEANGIRTPFSDIDVVNHALGEKQK